MRIRTSVRRAFARVALLLVPVTATAAPVAAQQSGSPDIAVRWEPERPAQGTLFRIEVRASDGSVMRPGATLADEVLHFRGMGPGAWEAIAAAPLDTGPSIELPLIVLRWGGIVDTLRMTIPVGRGEYRMEKLTVAPRFGAPPDSATAARLASERARAREVSRKAHATPRLWDEVVRPRDSRITSGFGDGREFNGQVQSRHTGTDFAGAVGAPVFAAARGVVALVDDFYLAGNVVYLDHGEGLVTAYFHLSRQDVAVGDTVEVGQVIGRVGNTGRVTGPHLHWVVRYGRISVDPLSLMALVGADTGT